MSRADRLHDISPPITAALVVFPGDTPPQREMLLDTARGDHITLSTLRSTVHLGAHVDGANHYVAGAEGVDAWPLERFVGPCRVTTGRIERGRVVAVEGPVDQARLLVRTDSYPDPEAWTDGFAGLAPAFVDELAAACVTLVGVDTPSVDTADSKALPAHARFGAHRMTILAGLVLTDVPDGVYELIALPLRLEGFDGSPVRAVLRAPGG